MSAVIEQPIEMMPRRELAVSATPSDLLRMAVEQGADLDRLERLMALQERWEKGEAVKAYNTAFTAFKAEAVLILKNRSVAQGPLSGKKYAELFAVINAATPALSRHGLSAAWRLTKDEKDWLEVTCTLKHVAGHSESVSMGGPPDTGGAKNAIQARASTVTYLERYTLKAITGLAEQDDDDNGDGGAQMGKPLRPGQAKAGVTNNPREDLNATLTIDERTYLRDMADYCTARVKLGNVKEASDSILDAELDDVQHPVMWGYIASDVRSAIKKHDEAQAAARKKG